MSEAKCPSCGVDLDVRLTDDDTVVLSEIPFVPMDVGDVVREKHGRGIPMTVEGYDGQGFDCVWFREGSDGSWSGPYRQRFDRRELALVTSARKIK